MPRLEYTDGENKARLLAAFGAGALGLALGLSALFGVALHSVMPWFYGALAVLFVVLLVIGR